MYTLYFMDNKKKKKKKNNVLREPVLTNHLWNLVALGQLQSAISQGMLKTSILDMGLKFTTLR